MTKLSVNLNRIALLRNSRNIGIPSVTRAATLVIAAGAHGIWRTCRSSPDPNILEVSIGHALIAEALEMGLANTVKAYLEILS